jgi:hypothetical protein
VRRQLPEIARIGASMATFPGIHLRLATGSSYLCGLQEQKERPEMARMEKIGGARYIRRASPKTRAFA